MGRAALTTLASLSRALEEPSQDLSIWEEAAGTSQVGESEGALCAAPGCRTGLLGQSFYQEARTQLLPTPHPQPASHRPESPLGVLWHRHWASPRPGAREGKGWSCQRPGLLMEAGPRHPPCSLLRGPEVPERGPQAPELGVGLWKSWGLWPGAPALGQARRMHCSRALGSHAAGSGSVAGAGSPGRGSPGLRPHLHLGRKRPDKG